jgi:hypothetical protein
MKKRLWFMLCGLGLAVVCHAQTVDGVSLSYQRNFIRANMATKIDLLNDASRITNANMTPLYVDAMGFAVQHYPTLGQDTQLLELAAVAASKVGAYRDPEAVPSLKKLLLTIPEAKVRLAILSSYPAVAKDRKDDIAFLNTWFQEAQTASLSGNPVDSRVLAAAAQALGKLGSSTSFAVLFASCVSPLDSSVVQASQIALNQLSDGYTANILAIIRNNGLQDMQVAYALSSKKDGLAKADRAQIAEAVFARLSTGKAEDATTPQVKELLLDSMKQLSELKWSQASPAVVAFFYEVQGAYGAGTSLGEYMIPVISCMGSMATSEAASALSIFLGLLNSETEQKKTYNEQLLLACIQSLGELGDKTAFDYLLYVGYLDYPEKVKQASRDALARLKW